MTRVLLALCVLLAALPLNAQLKEGKVLYERTIQFQARLQQVNPAIANGLPRSRTDRFELQFTPTKVLWEALPDMEEPEMGAPGGGGGGPVFMRFGSDDHVFTNLETGLVVSKQELASKNYLVTDSLRKLAWKLSDETKTILNHKARKAVAQRIGTRAMMHLENGEMKRSMVADTTEVTAWVTTEIPVAAGPEFNGQLPGLILELEMNRGRVVYRAVEVSSKVNTANIREPKGGKPITATEFAEERTKVFEAMRRNMPPGQRMNMRVQAN